jgi:hypothetical protein
MLISSPALTDFEAEDVEFSGNALVEIAEAVASREGTLRRINLGRNSLCDSAAVDKVVEALLTKLPQALSVSYLMGLTSRHVELFMQRGSLESLAVAGIPLDNLLLTDEVEGSCTVCDFDASGCGLDPKDAARLAKRYPSLRQIHLSERHVLLCAPVETASARVALAGEHVRVPSSSEGSVCSVANHPVEQFAMDDDEHEDADSDHAEFEKDTTLSPAASTNPSRSEEEAWWYDASAEPVQPRVVLVE